MLWLAKCTPTAPRWPLSCAARGKPLTAIINRGVAVVASIPLSTTDLVSDWCRRSVRHRHPHNYADDRSALRHVLAPSSISSLYQRTLIWPKKPPPTSSSSASYLAVSMDVSMAYPEATRKKCPGRGDLLRPLPHHAMGQPRPLTGSMPRLTPRRNRLAAITSAQWRVARWALRTCENNPHRRQACPNQPDCPHQSGASAAPGPSKSSCATSTASSICSTAPACTYAGGSPQRNAAASTCSWPWPNASQLLLRRRRRRGRTGHLQRAHPKGINAEIRLINARGYGHDPPKHLPR